MTAQSARITALYRYPVKGLSAQSLERADLKAHESITFDRQWAIENGPGRFDPAEPKHLPKVAFVMLMRDERLAALETVFEEESATLTLNRNGRQVARGNLNTRIGCQMIEQFIAAYMKGTLRGPPRILTAAGHCFSDVATKCLHIVNLASLRELERVSGATINPLRFRPNVIIDGIEPWAELGWMGQKVEAGTATLEAFDRTKRCAATNVEPGTGERNMAIPAILERTWGHANFGIYAKVASEGSIAVGDVLSAGAE